jgi:2-hydroxychromene-2-carboxylate isomerase
VSKAPRLYFSFRSPFSWLLVERLRREAPESLRALELIPYWEPDASTAAALAERGASIRYGAMSKAKHLYILQDTKRLSTALGLKMSWPVDVDPWWEPSHLGWLAARRDGCHHAYYDAVIDARWGRGEDISQAEVVAEATTAAGLDGNALMRAAKSGELRAEGVGCLQRAYEDDIFGVPYLILGWQRFWGVDRLDAFLDAFHAETRVRAPRVTVPPAVLESAWAYDNDTAGGCG